MTPKVSQKPAQGGERAQVGASEPACDSTRIGQMSARTAYCASEDSESGERRMYSRTADLEDCRSRNGYEEI